MAKKIIISFAENPTLSEPGFGYTIDISGFTLFYDNGTDLLQIDEIDVKPTLEETIQNLNTYLRENWTNDVIFYDIVGNTIEVTINADANVNVEFIINADITIDVVDIEPIITSLKYYIIFEDYVLNIYKANYQGTATEIFGTFTLNKSSVDSILAPIRGTGLQLSLEANQSLTFDEFILNDEFTYKTELLKNGYLIYKGYIKPDGVQQSYVNDEWLINIESTDGLGALKDLSFVQTNGLTFSGKMSFYDVIKGCLDRTKLSMTINTSVGISYVGYEGTNILKDVYVNASRFIKDSQDDVIMDCNEVLTSILNLFSAIITQQDGQWYILRPNDLVASGYVNFINQTTNVTFLKKLNKTLGSQINNFYPHHAGANQQIEVKGAISAYRINYKYGFLEGYLLNPNLNHDEDLVYENWTVNPLLPSGILLNNPLDLSGALMKSYFRIGSDPTIEVMTSDELPVLAGDVFTFKTKLTARYAKHNFFFKIKTSDGYTLNQQNEWVLTDATTYVNFGQASPEPVNLTYELKMPPILNDCDLTVTICRPTHDFTTVNWFLLTNLECTYIQITKDFFKEQGIIGEFHTVSRQLPPSSITKNNQEVFNGDGDALLVGSIYKEDLITPTENWTRDNKFESLPLLGISAMDDLRIQSNPIKIFSGSIYGQLPYLSVVTIDNVSGLFMFVDYDYDYKTNLSQVKLMQFYNSDLGDIYYEVSPNYGENNIKPTIKG
jgi:hypothetical protein